MSDDDVHECLICSHDISYFGVFDCGHFVCDICALRIRNFHTNIEKQQQRQHEQQQQRRRRGANDAHRVNRTTDTDPTTCPICRAVSQDVFVVRSLPTTSESFAAEVIGRLKLEGEKHRELRCIVESPACLSRLHLLTGFFCPRPECWVTDESGAQSQDAFVTMGLLSEHLKLDHKLQYCTLCIQHKPCFLSEQRVYAANELEDHMRGRLRGEPAAFTGHPQCLFCRQRFYCGEALLKHMQLQHMSCDLCNRGEFSFVFYQSRATLLKHFEKCHVSCVHRDCVNLDPMLRTFGTEIELQTHMQRVHGESAKMDLTALGFRFSAFDRDAGPPAARPAVSDSPAAQNTASVASTHASKIFFDFNTHIDEVNTTPDPAEREGQNNRRGGRGRGQQRPPPAPESLPVDRTAEQELKQCLVKHLAPRQLDVFKAQAAGYVAGNTMATEYFRQLQEFLPTEAALNAVFEPLVASMRDQRKRDALVQARTMLTSREVKKMEEVAAEESRERRAEELRRLTQQQRQQRGGNQGKKLHVQTTGKKGGNSAWASPATAAAAQGRGAKAPAKDSAWSTQGSTPAPPLASVLASAPSLGSTGATRWGEHTGGSRPDATFFDPSAFPELGSSHVTLPKKGGGAKPRGAWGK